MKKKLVERLTEFHALLETGISNETDGRVETLGMLEDIERQSWEEYG